MFRCSSSCATVWRSGPSTMVYFDQRDRSGRLVPAGRRSSAWTSGTGPNSAHGTLAPPSGLVCARRGHSFGGQGRGFPVISASWWMPSLAVGVGMLSYESSTLRLTAGSTARLALCGSWCPDGWVPRRAGASGAEPAQASRAACAAADTAAREPARFQQRVLCAHNLVRREHGLTQAALEPRAAVWPPGMRADGLAPLFRALVARP